MARPHDASDIYSASQKSPPLRFSKFFSQWLLYVHIYAKLQIFFQLSLSVVSVLAAAAVNGPPCKWVCWPLCAGHACNAHDRCVAAGYDNGDVKLFDLRAMSLRWETNVKNGVSYIRVSPSSSLRGQLPTCLTIVIITTGSVTYVSHHHHHYEVSFLRVSLRDQLRTCLTIVIITTGSVTYVSHHQCFIQAHFWGGGNFPPNFEFPPKNLRRGLLLYECHNTYKLTECSKVTK